jgi:Fic family protein
MNIKPNQPKALMLAKRQLSELVCDAVNLEGINFTLPEIQTLLDGVTIGGHKLSDQTIALNQGKAWEFLFKAIESKAFVLDKTFCCTLHNIAAKDEVLEWGHFRTGGVTIAGTEHMPPKADQLDSVWESMIEDSNNMTPMTDLMKSCLDPRVIEIMTE